MKRAEEIRKIWEEMKELKMGHEIGFESKGRCDYLTEKYEEMENLFDHESTLSKAIIYYLDNLTPNNL